MIQQEMQTQEIQAKIKNLKSSRRNDFIRINTDFFTWINIDVCTWKIRHTLRISPTISFGAKININQGSFWGKHGTTFTLHSKLKVLHHQHYQHQKAHTHTYLMPGVPNEMSDRRMGRRICEDLEPTIRRCRWSPPSKLKYCFENFILTLPAFTKV